MLDQEMPNSNRTAKKALVLTMAFAAACSSSQSDPRFGELFNPAARLDLSGVRSEIGFPLLVNPVLTNGQIPNGLRPRTLKLAPRAIRRAGLPSWPRIRAGTTSSPANSRSSQWTLRC